MKIAHVGIASLVAAAAAGFVSGCGNQPSPADVTTGYLKSLVAGDYKTAATYMADPGSVVISEQSAQSKKFVDDMLKSDKYTVGTQSITGKTATVQITVTAPDMTQLIPKLLKEDITLAFAGTNLNGAKGQKLVTKQFDSLLNSPQVPLTKNSAVVHLVQTNGGWKLAAKNTSMGNALTGNLNYVLNATKSN